jgi:hypothetical protein
MRHGGSSFSSHPESSVQRTIFFALILSYYEDSTVSAKPIFPVISDPVAISIGWCSLSHVSGSSMDAFEVVDRRGLIASNCSSPN